MLDAAPGQQIAVGEAFVGRTIVGHDPLHGDAEAAEPIDGAGGESDGALLAFVRQDLAVGQARGVIDGDVQVFPPGAALVALSGAVAGYAVTDPTDAAELLDIEMDDLARRFALIADDR